MAVTHQVPADGSAPAPASGDGSAGTTPPGPDGSPNGAGPQTAPGASGSPDGVAGPGSQRRLAQRSLHWGLRAVALAAAVYVWHWLTANDVELWLRFSKLPGPAETLTALWSELTEGQLVDHIQASIWRIVQGFALAGVAGVAMGVAIGRSRWAYDVMVPVLEVLRPIPAIAWVPIAILLFADSEQGMVFITFLAAVFPVVVSTRHAVLALPLVWEDAVRTMGGSRRAVLWRVVLPGALPGIFAGLSVAMGVAWICLISAEMLSGQLGVGYYTWMSYSLISYADVAAGMLTIGLLGLASAGVVELTGRWVTRWLPRSEVRA